MSPRNTRPVALAVCTALLAAPAAAHAQYRFTPVSVPLGLNGTVAFGINNGGQVAGNYYDAANTSRGFLYNTATGTFTLAPPVLPVTAGVVFNGINASGRVAGYYFTDAANPERTATPFVYSGGAAGTYTTIGGPVGAFGAQAYGINASGTTVGVAYDGAGNPFAFTYTAGPAVRFDGPTGGTNVTALGINDGGDIVGTYTDAAGSSRAYLYSGGTFATLSGPAGAQGVYLSGVNNVGQVAGYFLDANNAFRSFVYRGGAYTLLDAPGAVGGTFASGINDAGQVVGYYTDARGANIGFVASVVPEPGTWALVGGGLTVLAGAARTRRRQRA